MDDQCLKSSNTAKKEKWTIDLNITPVLFTSQNSPAENTHDQTHLLQEAIPLTKPSHSLKKKQVENINTLKTVLHKHPSWGDKYRAEILKEG